LQPCHELHDLLGGRAEDVSALLDLELDAHRISNRTTVLVNPWVASRGKGWSADQRNRRGTALAGDRQGEARRSAALPLT
jgi:hypothetical protein